MNLIEIENPVDPLNPVKSTIKIWVAYRFSGAFFVKILPNLFVLF
jgi:hypothetical protein